jgi:hypothetical protein
MRNPAASAFLLVVLLFTALAGVGQASADESDELRPVETGQSPAAKPARVPATVDSICNALAAAATENDLPIDFFTRLIWQESRFDPTAVSRAGAQGVAQFMPATATWRGLPIPSTRSTQSPNLRSSCATCAANLEISGSPQLPTMGARLARRPARTAGGDERLRAHRNRPIVGAMGRRKSGRWRHACRKHCTLYANRRPCRPCTCARNQATA